MSLLNDLRSWGQGLKQGLATLTATGSNSSTVQNSAASMTEQEMAAARTSLLQSPQPIDVRQLMKLYTAEELCQTAEDYYAGSDDWTGWMTKPFVCLSETPELLICFAHLLHGIKPVASMDILDFGAGPGWASYALTQLGGRVTVSDVSASALKIAAERFRRFPIAIPHTEPKYSHFNGRRFDLPDNSFDRIICIDAFHHVPNPAEVLNDMARVLRDGGMAAFAEPGPQHSWSPGAQYEMRHHRVVENDIVIEDIWKMAQAAGFGDIRLSVFGTSPFHVSLNEFQNFLDGGKVAEQCLSGVRHYMQNSRRLYFLTKGEPRPPDSRTGAGLKASIKLSAKAVKVRVGEPAKLSVQVTNSGSSFWLPASDGIGAVWLGMHLHELDDNSMKAGFFTHALPIEEGRGLKPGGSVSFEIEVGGLNTAGRYAMEFDLVAQQVAWFHSSGSETVRCELDVVGN